MENILPNYTGPYISNGKIQRSVEFGDIAPQDQLDALSRLHDSAYARWDDWQHRQAADEIYEVEAKKLAATFPSVAGNLVAYGNFGARSATTLGQRFATLGPLGVLVGGIENMVKLHDYMTNGDNYKSDVRKYYLTDPFPEYQGGSKKMDVNADKKRETYDPTVDVKEPIQAYLNPRRIRTDTYNPRVITGAVNPKSSGSGQAARGQLAPLVNPPRPLVSLDESHDVSLDRRNVYVGNRPRGRRRKRRPRNL